MPTKELKPNKTFTVAYSTGKEVLVERLPPGKLEAVSKLLESLFEVFFEYFDYSFNCLGDTLSDPRAWGYIEQLAALLPVVGQKELGINLTLLGNDYEQIGQIFLTQSINPETGAIEPPSDNKPILPSLIAQLYGQNFFRVKAVENYKKRQEKNQQVEKSPVVATP